MKHLFQFLFIQFVFFLKIRTYEINLAQNSISSDIKTLKIKLQEANKILKDMESSTLGSINHIIKLRLSEHTQKIEEYYKTVKQVKTDASYSNYIDKHCLGNDFENPKNIYSNYRLHDCYPRRKEITALDRTKARIESLEKTIHDLFKVCQHSIYPGLFEFCVKRKVNNFYQQIFWIEFEFATELKKIIINSESCATRINRNMNDILGKTKECVRMYRK